MDAIDLTGSGSDEDDPKRRREGFGAYAAPSSAGFAAASSSGATVAQGGQGQGGANPSSTSTSTSTSSPTHRPLGQQSQSHSSSSHNNNHASSSTSAPLSHSHSSTHSSHSPNNAIHRTASSSSALGSTSASEFPPNFSVAKPPASAPGSAADDDVMVTGQSGPSFGAMLGAASAAAHHYPSGSYSNGAGPGPSTSRADGASAAAAIDVDSLPPAPVSRRPNPKKPVCIGAFMSRAIMLYPQSCAMAGCGPPQGSKWDLVNFRGVEMIRVKLKVSTLLRARKMNLWAWPGGHRRWEFRKDAGGRTPFRRKEGQRTGPHSADPHTPQNLADDNSCAGLEHREGRTSRGRL